MRARRPFYPALLSTPLGRTERAAAWLLLALALALAGVALLEIATRRAPAQGFALERFAGADDCSAALRRGPRGGARTKQPLRIVSEPFLRRSRLGAGCRRWSAFMVVDRARRSQLELESIGLAELRIDGRLVTKARNRSGFHGVRRQRALDVGVHRVEVVQRQADPGVAYLRLREHDLAEPHFTYALPPLETRRFFADEPHAAAALRAGLSGPRPQRAPLALAAWIAAALCAWLALRAARGRSLPASPPDLALGAALTLLALWVRARGIRAQDVAWDELAYTIAGRNFVRNLRLGDFSLDAFRFNFYHPPLAKWLYGLGYILGGLEGARWLSALLSALSVGLLYAAARALYGRRVAAGAGAVATFLPGLVAHARLTGLESVLVFFWMASVAAAVAWLREVERARDAGSTCGHGYAALAAAAGMLSIGARMTALWIAPLLLLIVALGWGALPSRRRAGLLGALVLGAALALGAIALLWPWFSHDPLGSWSKIIARWDTQQTTEVFLGEDRAPPPVQYYLAAFAGTTPALLLLAALAGAALGLARPQRRRATIIALCWLAFPFLQSLSSFRQDLARYVIQAWPALALLAALGADELLQRVLARVHAGRQTRASTLLQVAWTAALPVYTALSLLRVEPYPLDYFNELLGGPAGVARSHAFELAWWGEGFRDAIDYVNRKAARGSRVRLALIPEDTVPRLRDDLRPSARGRADYVVTNYYKFQPARPRGCMRVHTVQVQHAPLVEVLRCPRAKRRRPRRPIPR